MFFRIRLLFFLMFDTMEERGAFELEQFILLDIRWCRGGFDRIWEGNLETRWRRGDLKRFLGITFLWNVLSIKNFFGKRSGNALFHWI